MTDDLRILLPNRPPAPSHHVTLEELFHAMAIVPGLKGRISLLQLRDIANVLNAHLDKRRPDFEEQMKTMEKERDEARAYGKKLYAEVIAHRQVTCVFCGHLYEDGTPASQDERLAAHISVCIKHPLRAVRAERDSLRARLAEAENMLRIFAEYGDGTAPFHRSLEWYQSEARKLLAATPPAEPTRAASDGAES